MASDPAPPPVGVSRSRRLWALAVLAGVVVVAGGGLVAWHHRAGGPSVSSVAARPTARPRADDLARGPAPSGRPPLVLAAVPGGCGLNADDDGELIFPSLAQYGYSGVTGLGTWDLLNGRQMVHHELSPAYGARGNVVVGFHREPSYQHMDELAVGDTIVVHDRACATFTYRVTMRAELTPAQAYPWVQATGGHDLTMVTCTPWWLDYNRIIWRAQLVS